MNKNTVEKMDILKIQESLLSLTRLYMRMLGGTIPSGELQLKECRLLIRSLAKDIADWADVYPSLFSSEASEK